MRLKDKVAVVTGAARGIGFACAKLFAEEGAKVVLGDVMTDIGPASAKAIDPSGQRAVFVKCDVGDPKDVQALIDTAVSKFGKLDICVANAGINRVKDFLDVTLDEWSEVIRVNLTGTFLTGQAAARQMAKQGTPGAIINMSSCNAVMAIPTITAYVASKGGINQLTRVMALSLAAKNIRVNAIGPGSISTDMVKVVAKDPSVRRAQMARTPLGRYGEPEEVARVALFLATEDSSYITGQTIYPDGGRLALNYTVPVKDDA
ncbi:MAG: SDR family oxidoreductase [Alphaproteobacteria bacterium]|nr:SDR family oxidoreductase [Alphaproteobacteria bacterium]